VAAAAQEMMVQFQHLVVPELQAKVLQAVKVVAQMVQTAEHFGVAAIHGQVVAAVFATQRILVLDQQVEAVKQI
jgi:hypothetical protein